MSESGAERRLKIIETKKHERAKRRTMSNNDTPQTFKEYWAKNARRFHIEGMHSAAIAEEVWNHQAEENERLRNKIEDVIGGFVDAVQQFDRLAAEIVRLKKYKDAVEAQLAIEEIGGYFGDGMSKEFQQGAQYGYTEARKQMFEALDAAGSAAPPITDALKKASEPKQLKPRPTQQAPRWDYPTRGRMR